MARKLYWAISKPKPQIAAPRPLARASTLKAWILRSAAILMLTLGTVGCSPKVDESQLYEGIVPVVGLPSECYGETTPTLYSAFLQSDIKGAHDTLSKYFVRMKSEHYGPQFRKDLDSGDVRAAAMLMHSIDLAIFTLAPTAIHKDLHQHLKPAWKSLDKHSVSLDYITCLNNASCMAAATMDDEGETSNALELLDFARAQLKSYERRHPHVKCIGRELFHLELQDFILRSRDLTQEEATKEAGRIYAATQTMALETTEITNLVTINYGISYGFRLVYSGRLDEAVSVLGQLQRNPILASCPLPNIDTISTVDNLSHFAITLAMYGGETDYALELHEMTTRRLKTENRMANKQNEFSLRIAMAPLTKSQIYSAAGYPLFARYDLRRAKRLINPFRTEGVTLGRYVEEEIEFTENLYRESNTWYNHFRFFTLYGFRTIDILI